MIHAVGAKPWVCPGQSQGIAPTSHFAGSQALAWEPDNYYLTEKTTWPQLH